MAGKLFFLILGCCSCCLSFCLELKQVLILSRHNLRTPIAERLQTMSSKPWLRWDQGTAQLTKKGAILEGYLGDYFSQWLNDNRLIQGCPDEDLVHVYANTPERTRDTAKAFVGAFRNCTIPVVSINSTEMDPIFNPVLHNTTEVFREQAFSEMNKKLEEIDLRSMFLELNRITDIKNSQICKEKSYCDLAMDKSEIFLQVGREPDLVGPLFIGASVVDAFIMAYFEGYPLNDIAWGDIKTEEELLMLAKVLSDYQSVRFDVPNSKDYAKPLLQYMKEMFNSDTIFTLLVGHDSNLSSVIAALEFKLFELPGNYEKAPIGAKLVFQRWNDGVNDFLKVEYVYESWPQIRNAEELSMSNPPKNITMHFNVSDEIGFYPWRYFEGLLEDVTQ